jgi:di/tricarboxylate transporter
MLASLPVTPDQAIAFAIIAAMMVLFVWEKIRYDLTALLGLVVAIAAGIVPVDQAFSGFSDQVVVIVASALVVSAGVGKSGVISRLARAAEPYMKTPGARVTVLAAAVAVLSSFVKNIGALAILLPMALRLARRSGTSPSTLLMPMAFASLIGGLVTLVGTSPNILVSRAREEILGQPFAMFDFAPVGAAIAVAGLGFLAVGWRLLPRDRGAAMQAEDLFKVEDYLIEACVPKDSPFVNKTVAELEALSDGTAMVAAVVREGGHRYVPAGHWWLFADDLLLIRGDAHAVRELVEEARLELIGTEEAAGEAKAPTEVSVVECVVMAGSPLIGRSAAEIGLRDRFGVNLVGIGRPGRPPTQSRLQSTPFKVGDVLILQGSAEGTLDTLNDLGCLPLADRATGLGSPRKDYLPLLILALAIAATATKLVPVTAAFFVAAVVIVVSGVLTLKEAYNALDPPILVLLACLIPISDAISSTGASEIIANGLSAIADPLPPTGAVTLILAAAMAVTPFLNNAATVLIMAPIGASVAKSLGLNPDPFLMAVAIGAACDFLSPVGHQCNTLVMGPGGYRFGDYAKLGFPLSLIVICVGSLLIPIFWPFAAP